MIKLRKKDDSIEVFDTDRKVVLFKDPIVAVRGKITDFEYDEDENLIIKGIEVYDFSVEKESLKKE